MLVNVACVEWHQTGGYQRNGPGQRGGARGYRGGFSRGNRRGGGGFRGRGFYPGRGGRGQYSVIQYMVPSFSALSGSLSVVLIAAEMM